MVNHCLGRRAAAREALHRHLAQAAVLLALRGRPQAVRLQVLLFFIVLLFHCLHCFIVFYLTIICFSPRLGLLFAVRLQVP